jgi:hypothetical protein
MKPCDEGEMPDFTTCADSWYRPGVQVVPDDDEGSGWANSSLAT